MSFIIKYIVPEKFKFRLTRLKSEIVVGIPSSETADRDFKNWLDALRPYVISHDIWSEFQFSDLLGQGSYGKVFLA